MNRNRPASAAKLSRELVCSNKIRAAWGFHVLLETLRRRGGCIESPQGQTKTTPGQLEGRYDTRSQRAKKNARSRKTPAGAGWRNPRCPTLGAKPLRLPVPQWQLGAPPGPGRSRPSRWCTLRPVESAGPGVMASQTRSLERLLLRRDRSLLVSPPASLERPRAATSTQSLFPRPSHCQWPGGASGRRPACHSGFRSGPTASGLRVSRCTCRPQA